MARRVRIVAEVERLAPVARAIASKLTRFNPQHIEDCVQEGLFRLSLVLRNGQRHDGYLTQAMKFAMIDWLRKQPKHQKQMGRRALGLGTYQDPPDDAPDSEWHYEEWVHRPRIHISPLFT